MVILLFVFDNSTNLEDKRFLEKQILVLKFEKLNKPLNQLICKCVMSHFS